MVICPVGLSYSWEAGWGCGWARGGRNQILASSTGAEGAVAVAALRALSHDLPVDVLGIVRVDVASPATAVGNLRCSHCR